MPAAPPLVGREREQAALRAALDAALAERGSLVLIGGEAGIGKTALAEWLLAEAAGAGALALVGRCYDLAETPPYGPWAEALAPVPRYESRPPVPDFGGGGATSQAALFAQVRDYLVALAARRPLVLLLDDLHWADPASLDLLRSLARGLADAPALVLATYRVDELTRRHPLYALLPLLVREARAERLDLRPLDEAALGALVRARHALAADDEARLVAYLAARSEGNPLFAGELLRTAEESGALGPGGGWRLGDLAATGVPPLLRQVLDARLDRLGEDARGRLAVAAVIGQAVPLGLWAAASGAPEDDLIAVAERAIAAGLLAETPDGAGVRFAHALIREALYEGLGGLRRPGWHRRAAEALAGGPDPDPDAVAYHFQRARDPRAAAWLMRAGERAVRAYAWLTAAERFEAALALLEAAESAAVERAWLHFHLAKLRRYADPRDGIARLDAAADLAGGVDPALDACIALQRGLLRCFVGDTGRGIAEMRAGVAAYDALSPAEQERIWPLRTDDGRPTPDDGRGTLALWLAPTGRFAEARAVGERVASRSRRDDGMPVDGDACVAVAYALAFLGLPGEAARWFEHARAAYRAVGHQLQVGESAVAQLEFVALPYLADRPAEPGRLVAELAAALARAGGVFTEGAHLARLYTLPHLEVAGGWAEARALGEAERAAHAQLGGTRFPGVLARIARHRGEPDRARALVRAWFPDGPAAAPGDARFAPAVALQRVAAALAIDGGDLPAARAWLEAHDRWLAWSGAVLGRAEGELGWAAYRRAAGDPVGARERAEAALARAATPRQPLALLAAHRLLGELDTADGRHDEAAAHLAAALALADACDAPFARALTLLARAELQRASGDRDAASTTLSEASTILARLGAAPALARADALADRLAAVPVAAGPAVGLPFGLTAREAGVLRLVAEGLTNAQVAERLFLSPKTISRHLDSIYAKLGVATRTAAARIAVEHRLV
jgi:DNA-binding CsgD family transcriptional regulator